MLQLTEKHIQAQEALAKMILENCYKARIELGLVQGSAPPTGGLSEEDKMKLIFKRRKVRSNQKLKTIHHD